MKMKKLGELEFLNMIRPYVKAPGRLNPPFGDDAAVFIPNKDEDSRRMAMTTDMLVQNTHFSLHYTPPFDLGIKSFEVNASDLAAMGAWPAAALISLAVPPDLDVEFLREFYKGFSSSMRKYDCVLAGGDTVRGKSLVISVTLLGTYVPKKRTLMRTGARPGDWIYVTGTLGDSAMGLYLLKNHPEALTSRKRHPCVKRHLTPEARVREGNILSGFAETGAVIDISDGLYNELNHLANMNGLSMNIGLASLPCSRHLCFDCYKYKQDMLEMMLFGGEDYELLFTSSMNPTIMSMLVIEEKISVKISAIGTVTEGKGVHVFRNLSEKKELVMKNKTFQHFV